MGDRPDPKSREAAALRRDSERLLKAIEELRELEQLKRREPVSSRPFRDLAQKVEEKAREVYRLADEEVDDARDAADRESDEVIADDEPEAGGPAR
jgi:signal transduction histidine kinase